MKIFYESTQVTCGKCGKKYAFIVGGHHSCKKNLLVQLFQKLIETIKTKKSKNGGRIQFEPNA